MSEKTFESLTDPAVLDDLSLELKQKLAFVVNSGCAVDLFATNDADFAKLQLLLGGNHRRMLADRSDAVHLSTLLDEVVPDTADLDLKHVLKIRQDDSFQEWRDDLRTAIRRMITVNSVPQLAGEGLEEVRALMRERSARLTETISQSRPMAGLRGQAASFAIAGVGAASVLPIVGQANVTSEVTMLAGSLGIGGLLIGLDAVRKLWRNSGDGSAALAHHYAFVAKCATR